MTREEARSVMRALKYDAQRSGYITFLNPERKEAFDMAIESLSTERPKGRWEWKHRMKGGFHTYTGVDSMGEIHTITVDERHETEEPYCPNCGKWNDSQWLDFCPNCGSDNRGEEE